MDAVTVVKVDGKISEIKDGGAVVELTPEMAEFFHNETRKRLKELERRLKELERRVTELEKVK